MNYITTIAAGASIAHIGRNGYIELTTIGFIMCAWFAFVLCVLLYAVIRFADKLLTHDGAQ